MACNRKNGRFTIGRPHAPNCVPAGCSHLLDPDQENHPSFFQ
jgi:hypothetical protein